MTRAASAKRRGHPVRTVGAGKRPLSNKALGLTFYDVPDPVSVKAKMPPPLTPLIDGDIAFRQHDQGHTDAPNWSTFLEFCGHYFKKN